MAAAVARQALSDEVCCEVPTEALPPRLLPGNGASSDADRLLAVMGPGGTSELLMTLRLPTGM
ncbi:hypothetical protein AB0K68_36050 [Streptomyces sp. NPDC050698]